MTNRLAGETSPYLLEHAENPVDWYPWGPEALSRAREESRPILLSIGYSACHWCHVMARESFQDPEIATLMNTSFVCIKVDREERPDLDQVYMRAVQGMTGSGGWPMTVFLLPDGTPFFGGTYFPPADRYGMPSFRRVLQAVAEAYNLRKAEVLQTAAELRIFLNRPTPVAAPEALTNSLLDDAYRRLESDYDAQHGGFGGAPKFPQPMLIDFQLRTGLRTGQSRPTEMATQTLRAMAEGGIYDQLGGGFHRYSVDEHWLVPHFEKMLYDNALLARAYLDAWRRTADPFFARIAAQTVEFVAREMTSPEGGFYSSLDADSAGEEGLFYVWTPAELRQVLGDARAMQTATAYDVTEEGNFEGRSILHPLSDDSPQILDAVREPLMAARSQRARPHRDEKVLAGWNGLMLRSLAEAALALNRADLQELATRNGRFLLEKMRAGRRMLRSYKDGRATLPGYLEDQAGVIVGLVGLYNLSLDPSWLGPIRELTEEMLRAFFDAKSNAFFDTAAEHETLVVRPQDITDNAVPSGTSLAVEVLLRAGALLGKTSWVERGRATLEHLAPTAVRTPLAFGHLLCCLDFELARPIELAIMGATPAARDPFIDVVRRRYLPNLVLAGGFGPGEPDIQLIQDRTLIDGRPTAYLCEAFVCQEPSTDPARLEAQLDAVSAVPAST